MTLHPINVDLLAEQRVKDTSIQRDKASAIAAAARQFEGLLLQQLIRILRTTGRSEESSCEQTYLEMFDGQLADQLAEGGGIGIAREVESALSKEGPVRTTHRVSPIPFQPGRFQPNSVVAPSGAALAGQTRELQRAAEQMMNQGVQQWSRQGALSDADLQSRFASIDSNGREAGFVVREALGFQGYNKCNLFAFELARRAGFTVPLVTRPEGWGFPSSNRITRDAAEDGRLNGGWAEVVGNVTAAQLDAGIVQGKRAFILAGSGRDRKQGHMAVIERLRDLKYDREGAIRTIVFDGWEARPTAGAEHLVQRTWNVGHGSGGRSARSGLEHIALLELTPAIQSGNSEVPISTRYKDVVFNSNISSDHPNDRLETLP